MSARKAAQARSRGFERGRPSDEPCLRKEIIQMDIGVVARMAWGARPDRAPQMVRPNRSWRSYGFRDGSPGASTTSAPREPFGPTQEFAVSG